MHEADCASCMGAGSLKQVVLECGPFFCFHHVNACEDASGNVTLDCIAMHGGVDFSMNFSNLSHEFFAKPPWRTSLTRLSLNPITAAVWAHSNLLALWPVESHTWGSALSMQTFGSNY